MNKVEIVENCAAFISRVTASTNIVHTRNASEQLSCKILNLGTRKRDKTVALEKVKDTLAQQVGDDANVISIVE